MSSNSTKCPPATITCCTSAHYFPSHAYSSHTQGPISKPPWWSSRPARSSTHSGPLLLGLQSKSITGILIFLKYNTEDLKYYEVMKIYQTSHELNLIFAESLMRQKQWKLSNNPPSQEAWCRAWICTHRLNFQIITRGQLSLRHICMQHLSRGQINRNLALYWFQKY